MGAHTVFHLTLTVKRTRGWGDQPPFGTPVYVFTHTAPRPSIPMEGGTTFHFRDNETERWLRCAEEISATATAGTEGG